MYGVTVIVYILKTGLVSCLRYKPRFILDSFQSNSYTKEYIYIYIYIYMCVCVCVCACASACVCARPRYVSHNIQYTFL